MKERGEEALRVHSRLLKCGLEVESSREYWSRSMEAEQIGARRAFDEYWFGARSLSRTKVIIAEMKKRYGAYPTAFEALRILPSLLPRMRLLICHWHLQLTDPLYRSFTGEKLPERRSGCRAEVTLEVVDEWLRERVGKRWSSSTRALYVSKLLSAAFQAGLIGGKRDPRQLIVPRVPDDALEYLLYLLKDVQFEGTLFDNPYVRSLGLDPSQIDYRVRRLPGIALKRQGTLCDFDWKYTDLIAWANAKAPSPKARAAGRRG